MAGWIAFLRREKRIGCSSDLTRDFEESAEQSAVVTPRSRCSAIWVSATRIAYYRNLSVANRFCWDNEPDDLYRMRHLFTGKTPLDSCDSLLANPAAIDNKQAWEFDLKEPACSQCI
jgi:hypothetical protein